MAKTYYCKTHEYVRERDGSWQVGLSAYAVSELGDITFVELPSPGSSFSRGEVFATVESVKAVASCYAPLDMTILQINERLQNEPELVNQDPLGAGYFVEVTITNPSQLSDLLSEEDYAQLEKEHHD